MAIIKDRGIVLRRIKDGEANLRLVLLLEERGKVVVFAKGASKSSSKLNAAANPFNYTEFIIFDGGNFLSLNQAAVIHSFNAIRHSYGGFVAASLCLELCDKMLMPAMDARDALTAALTCFNALDKNKDPKTVMAIAIFKILQAEGFVPIVDVCATCGLELEHDMVFTQDGLVCGGCGCGVGIAFNGDCRPALNYILTADNKRLFSFNTSGSIIDLLYDAALLFLHANIDAEFNSLKMI